MTQIFKGKCITNRHRIFACVYAVDFLEEWKEGGIFFFKTPCSSPRAWLSVTLVCYIVHRTQWSIFEISIRKLWGKLKTCFLTHMVLITWKCIKKDIVQNAENHLKKVMAFYSNIFIFYFTLSYWKSSSKVLIFQMRFLNTEHCVGVVYIS